MKRFAVFIGLLVVGGWASAIDGKWEVRDDGVRSLVIPYNIQINTEHIARTAFQCRPSIDQISLATNLNGRPSDEYWITYIIQDSDGRAVLSYYPDYHVGSNESELIFAVETFEVLPLLKAALPRERSLVLSLEHISDDSKDVIMVAPTAGLREAVENSRCAFFLDPGV